MASGPRARLGAALAALFFVTTPSAAQGPAAVPDLSDGWVRLDTVGSNNFDGLTSTFTPAVLTPAGQAELDAAPGRQLAFDFLRDASQPRAEGETYVVGTGACGGNQVPLEPNSAAFFMTQTADKVLITREGGGSRHVHLDGRGHPDLATWEPTALGHSIARYEDGDLVVDTVGLTMGAVTAGGRRHPATRLTERFALSPDGARLTITYTWTDPAIYVTPHSYMLSFERLPEDSYHIENWCDSSDPAFAQSITVPVQPE
jgi:hypothetical protein